MTEHEAFPNYAAARRADLPTHASNGLPLYNRAELTWDEFVSFKRRKGDLFAMFKNKAGGFVIEYASYEDFSAFAFKTICGEKRRVGSIDITVDVIARLCGIIMISREHGHDFEDFVSLVDHDLSELFDSAGLTTWIGMNQELFMSDAQALVESDPRSDEEIAAEEDEEAGEEELEPA